MKIFSEIKIESLICIVNIKIILSNFSTTTYLFSLQNTLTLCVAMAGKALKCIIFGSQTCGCLDTFAKDDCSLYKWSGCVSYVLRVNLQGVNFL